MGNLMGNLDGVTRVGDAPGSGTTSLPPGMSLQREASLRLSDAQIKSLVGSPQIVIPAPGVNQVIVPVRAWLFFDTRAGFYTNYDAWNVADPFPGSFQLMWQGTGQHAAGPAAVVNIGAGRGYGTLTVMSAIGGTEAFGTYAPSSTVFEAAYTNDMAAQANTALVVALINAKGELTGGNAANFMVWTVAYRLLDLVTGILS